MKRFQRHLRQLDTDQLYIVWHALIMLQACDDCTTTTSAHHLIEDAISAAEGRLQEEE